MLIFICRAGVNPSVGPAGKTFWALTILHRPESRGFADPWQTPLIACDEPMFFTPRPMNMSVGP
jgi:hypothetical protein